MALSRTLGMLPVAAAMVLAAQAANVGPPSVIHLCDADNPGWCWTYTRNGDHYDGVGDRGGRRTMTLESFTPESVVMRMTQEGRPGWYSVNSGKMSSEGGSLTAGVWSDSNGGKGRITATWSAGSATQPAASTSSSKTAKPSTPAKAATPVKAAAPATAKQSQTASHEVSPAKPGATAKSEAASEEAKPLAIVKPPIKQVSKPAVKPAVAEPEK